jgi:hypothetical protein
MGRRLHLCARAWCMRQLVGARGHDQSSQCNEVKWNGGLEQTPAAVWQQVIYCICVHTDVHMHARVHRDTAHA